MTDPFGALRQPGTPADPDPGFACRLRQRLTRQVFASPRRNHVSADPLASRAAERAARRGRRR